ncbi:carbohydrate ABC transporter permease [Diplocloster agilis]|uniref:Sugar ABC transporter permease n=1 Tax=Diplocloster agilis TaxID=2850323 RepID=A0A949JXL3_9FIRM|nr:MULTISPECIES: sugar ABC transporter permease [Lachnospiraceae]MBU9737048.1 sugar ABC transporter permease [Diplocloster agilis]MBU9744215.1 sugar ABC transporter permease [Diplocloster agilis]MCU6732513.1 sugar ABC transporter permease [Suonthocola fibrivorans]SCI49377.1 Inner membrane ABC transporter permease protein ycjO [uncultured Clostridium sp.]
MRKNPLQPKGWKIGTVLLLPVGVYIFMVIIPIFFAAYYSLFKWSGGKSMTFLGMQNYLDILRDDTFWLSFRNTAVFTLLMVVGQVGIAFVFTLFFTMKWMKWTEFHRRVMFITNIISAVVIGLLWQIIYSNQAGILNEFLRAIGREDWIRPWLDDPKIVLFSVAVPVIWQFVGYYLVIMTSAIASVPKDILEMAEVDGASGWKRSIYITIPMIYDTLKVCIMICIAGSFKTFDHISVMTGGGPGNSSMVLSLYNYDVSFSMMKMGYGCALAVMILVISLLLTLGSRLLLGGKRYE